MSVELDRLKRYNVYMKNINWDMDKFPDVLHIITVNFQGSGKDILTNADIFELYFKNRSIFDLVITKILNRPHYKRKISNVYANCDLNKEVYGNDFTRIDSIKDIEACRDGVIYFNDIEGWFNSRGYSLVRADKELLDIVNNIRKDGCLIRGSAHRYMSIDVKLRSLVPLWIFPDIYLKSSKVDMSKMNSWKIIYKVRNGDGKVIFNDKLNDLPIYCGLYNTLEKCKPLVKNDL